MLRAPSSAGNSINVVRDHCNLRAKKLNSATPRSTQSDTQNEDGPTLQLPKQQYSQIERSHNAISQTRTWHSRGWPPVRPLNLWAPECSRSIQTSSRKCAKKITPKIPSNTLGTHIANSHAHEIRSVMNSSITATPLFLTAQCLSTSQISTEVRVLATLRVLHCSMMNSPPDGQLTDAQDAAESTSKRSAQHKPWPAQGLQAIPSRVWPQTCNRDFPEKYWLEKF